MNMDVRFYYHRDSSTKGRVLTVARRLSEDRKSVEFGVAICRPKKMNGNSVGTDGDAFVKQAGRDLATKRLNGLVDPAEEGTVVRGVVPLTNLRPMETVLACLLADKREFVRRMAAAALYELAVNQ